MSDNLPLVSVIVPSFNHERFIEQCLRSVVDQSFPHIEVIVIDDCSSDSTFERAKAFLEEHRPRFNRVVLRRNNVNRGAPASLNRGLPLAKGNYVSFLNSDDLYAPSRIGALLEALQLNKSEIAFSRTLPIDEAQRPNFADAFCHDLYLSPAVARARYPSLSWGILWKNLAVSSGNMILTQPLAARIGAFIPMKYCHDWDYLLRATFYCEPAYLDEELYLYRIHGGNTFSTLQDVGITEMAEVVKRHARRCGTALPPNKLAAAPQYWPSLYQSLLHHTGKGQFIDSIYQPYKAYHRVVECAERKDHKDQFESSADLRVQVGHLQEALKDQLRKNSEQAAELSAAQDLSADLQQIVEKHAAVLQQLNAEFATVQGRTAELERALNASSAALARIESQSIILQDQNLELEQVLRERASGAESVEAELAAARVQVGELSEALKRKSAELVRQTTDLEAVLAAQSRELQLIKGSTSWRITAVLRNTSGKFPRFTRQVLRVMRLLWWTATLQLVGRLRTRRRRKFEWQTIISSGLFDRDWYLQAYPDICFAGTDPVVHYLDHGATEGRSPSVLFDTRWYLEQNPDVRNAGLNPLVHYLRHGIREGRLPAPQALVDRERPATGRRPDLSQEPAEAGERALTRPIRSDCIMSLTS